MYGPLTNARAFAFAARLIVFACASSLGACGLLYGFDRYDTEVTALPEGSAADGLEPPAADFDLVVADSLRIEPGTSAPLVVSVVRHPGTAERITVVVREPVPAGVELGLAATIEPGASSATLIVTVRRDASATTQSLHLQAVSASETRTKDVALTARGAPCAPDRGFGLSADGVVHVLLPSGDGALLQGLALAASGDAVTFALRGSPLVKVFRVDATGTLEWSYGAVPDTVGISVDGARGVVLVARNALTRIAPDGGEDLSFGTMGNGVVVPSCSPISVTAETSDTSVICAFTGGSFTSSRFDGNGAETPGETIDFGPDFGAKLVVSRESPGGGHVACGGAVDSQSVHPAFARWLASGKRDEAFGIRGRVALDAGGVAGACASDDAGIVAIQVDGPDLRLLAVSRTGVLDPTFGDAGFRTVELDSGAPIASSKIAFDADAILVVASQGADGRASLLRYLRDGRLDATFGSGGECALGALGLANVGAVLVTTDHKLLVLTTGTGATDALLARIWL